MLTKLGFLQQEQNPIFCYSKAAMAITNNKRSTHNCKWIGKMEIIMVPYQGTDIMMKTLWSTKFVANAAASDIVVYE